MLLRNARPKRARLEHEAIVVEPDQLVGRPKPFQLKPLYQAASPIGSTTNSVNSSSAGGRNSTIVATRPSRNSASVADAQHAGALRASVSSRAAARWSARRTHRRGRQLPCFHAALDRLRGILRRHAAAGDLGGDVVHHAADRGPERLIVEVLVVVRARDVLRDVAQERRAEAGLRALVGRE